ncbi:MAG TPA: hypothetical protein VL180_07820 [Burkholderiales bacterium]|jgi:hypothetical protein|nr:hypothetical protein [Burkholderiales bacterium]
MKVTRPIWRQIAPHAAGLLFLLAAGCGLVWTTHLALARENRAFGALQSERRQAAERLARAAQEEREVHDHAKVYRRLQDLRIIGEERRLEWVETLARIRAAREFAELRYQIERQKVLKTLPGKPALELRSSSMKLELGLLHEGDFLGFLEDLRASGNAYYSVRQCSITRVADAVPAAAPLAPRLRTVCQIELITLAEAKSGS